MTDDLTATKSAPPPQAGAGRTRPARADRPRRRRGEPLVTSRNNSHAPVQHSVFEVPRPSVAACCRATLATYRPDGVRFSALTCKSWSCPVCRPAKGARLLDRLRAGLESRDRAGLHLATLTLDPAAFGAHVVGTAFWDANGRPVTDPALAVRATNLWSEPTRAQFDAAAAAMSRQFDQLVRAVNARAKRAGLDPWGYFRVVELHRNVWPHYHVVFEHAQLADAPDLELWDLGRWDVRPVSIDDAVGEVAPYLVSSESKGKGHKAYQFAAPSLPRGFRLHTSSRGFLAPPVEPTLPPPDHALVARGHFTSHHETARAWGAESRLLLPTPGPAERPYRPPSAALATGDGAVLLYAELADAEARRARPLTHLSAAAPDAKGPAHPRAGTAPPGGSEASPN